MTFAIAFGVVTYIAFVFAMGRVLGAISRRYKKAAGSGPRLKTSLKGVTTNNAWDRL